jgi:hypothetical protein
MFGTENSGSTSAPQTIKLANTGNAPLSISTIGIGGNWQVDYAQTNNCGNSVAAGSNCTINVTFTPHYAWAYTSTATLAITDNANGSPQTVSLSGSGISIATTPGTYPVTVLASSGNDMHNLNVSVTVQ